MSRLTTFGSLISVRSVVDKWQEVKSEHVERWREIVIDHCQSERDIWRRPKGDDDLLSATFDSIRKMGLWQNHEPPEFEFHTGIILSEQQRKDFNKGNVTRITYMIRNFMKDAFGELLEKRFPRQIYRNPVEPLKTQFAEHHWHRDPSPVVVFVTNILPMKLLRGPMQDAFQQNHDKMVFSTVGQHNDFDMIGKIDQWAEEEKRLVVMHTNEIVLDVGRSWHCPVINTARRPIPRILLRMPCSLSPSTRM